MDQTKATELFKKMGKLRPNETEEMNTPQSKPSWRIDEQANPWTEVTQRAERNRSNTGRNTSGSGRGGRGDSGGRGGRGSKESQLDPDYVPDPHEGNFAPPMEWTETQCEIYERYAENIMNGIEDDLISDITPRDGDAILLHLLLEKVDASGKCKKSKGERVRTLRVLHRSMLLNAINTDSAFEEILTMIEQSKYTKITISSPPASLMDLYSAEGRRAVYTMGGEKKKKKTAYIQHMLAPYLMRMYLNTPRLAEVYEGLDNSRRMKFSH